MIKSKLLIITMLLTGITALYGQNPVKAPNIQAVTIDGRKFNLEDVKAKHTIMLFWSYTCPHCRDLVKELGELVSEHDDIELVTVQVSGELRDVKRIIRKNKLKKHYNICDEKGWHSPIVEDYNINMTPTILILDENKMIVEEPFDIADVIEYFEK